MKRNYQVPFNVYEPHNTALKHIKQNRETYKKKLTKTLSY